MQLKTAQPCWLGGRALANVVKVNSLKQIGSQSFYSIIFLAAEVSQWGTIIELRWAVIVSQLAEPSLLTPEIRGSNPNMGKIISTNCNIKRRKEMTTK